MTTTVLIVEDDPQISGLLRTNLESTGLTCFAVNEGSKALEAFDRVSPALVILDITLPGIDGLEVLRQIRQRSAGAAAAVPVLMLTARGSESDKVLGFEIGADDYVTKPFSTRELVARVRALLRRTRTEVVEIIERGGLRIDPSRRRVSKNGVDVEVTSLEFDVLLFMASRPGRVLTRQALMDQVWGEGRVVDDRSIDSLVSRLRRKLEEDPAKPAYLQTVWGAGYRFSEGPYSPS
ncbi:MAG: response regulator transcription factor [Acidobacteriota bacterium]